MFLIFLKMEIYGINMIIWPHKGYGKIHTSCVLKAFEVLMSSV